MQDHLFQAVQEALGDQVVNDGLKHQVNTRVEALQQNAKNENIYGRPGQQDLDMYMQALKESLGQNVVSLNVERQLRQRVSALRAGNNPPAPGTSGPGATPQGDNNTVSRDIGGVKGDVQGDVNAQQKQAFEQTGGTAGVQGTGGNAQTGGGRSQVAAATNTGNTGAGGPGAGSMNQTGTGNPSGGVAGGAAATRNPNPS